MQAVGRAFPCGWPVSFPAGCRRPRHARASSAMWAPGLRGSGPASERRLRSGRGSTAGAAFSRQPFYGLNTPASQNRRLQLWRSGRAGAACLPICGRILTRPPEQAAAGVALLLQLLQADPRVRARGRTWRRRWSPSSSSSSSGGPRASRSATSARASALMRSGTTQRWLTAAAARAAPAACCAGR